MMIVGLRARALWLLTAITLGACGKAHRTEPPRKTIGDYTTSLSVYVGGTWNDGYSVYVSPEEYAVVEHAKCANAKETGPTAGPPKGLCVLRPTKDQSDRFVAAMERFKRYAVPLQSYSVDNPFVRPDGKPCKNEVTDSTIITLMWTGTEGAKVASFYTGCDREEFNSFYKSALAVTDPLPIQQIIGGH
jgi:hypothetical protein